MISKGKSNNLTRRTKAEQRAKKLNRTVYQG